MKVFVTGGTGAIGRHAVSALVAAGHSVTALARRDAKAVQLREQGATAVQGSLFDTEAMARVFGGHDAVVNLATALPSTSEFTNKKAWAENFRVRSEGSASVVNAALQAGVPRLIQESVSMIYRDQGSAWVDETGPTDDFLYARSNLAAEANLARFTTRGGAGTVLRFGWLLGPHATHSEEFLAMARRWRICIMLGAPSTYLSSIHVEDAGRAVVAALGAPPSTYNIVDDEPLTKRAYAVALANAAGLRFHVRAPGRLALLFGSTTTSITRSLRVSNARFKSASGWTPRFPSAREGWRALAAG